jgi:hypothetical protein
MEMKKIGVLAISMYLMIACSVLAFDDPDLVFYFSFESFDGNTVPDQSGQGHNGTINGNIESVDGGKHGKAAKFEQTSFIDMDGPNIPEGHTPRDEMTLCAWAKCEKAGDHQTLFNARASDGTWVVHPEFRNEGHFRWLLRSDGGAELFDIRAGTIKWGEWTHYAGVYDGKNGILYINGEKVAENPAGAPTIAKDWGQGARVGYDVDDSRPFTGLMDDLCMWKRALTEEEINILMENSMIGLLAVSPAGSLTTTWGGLKRF